MRAFLWGRKMPLPNIIEFIGTNITQRKFQEAQEKLLSYLGVEVPTKTELSNVSADFNAKITPKADKTYVDNALSGFTNGASKFYPTLAEATADIANIGIKDKVDIGETANGGIWYKATVGATTLTKSAYDPLTQAKADATTKANAAEANANALTLDKTKNIKLVDVDGFAFGLADADDKVFLLIDASGEIIVTNLEGSVQSSISKLKQSLDVTDAPFALGFKDKNDRLLGYFKNNSELMLSGLSESVQSSVNHLLHRQDDIMQSLNQHEVILSKYLLPSDFNVNSSQVLASTVNINPQAIQYLPISTPYRKNDSLVHPNVIELDEPMRGFKYWMCLTPYQGNNILEENPCVYGSNDLQKWELIDGMPQPLDNPPDWDEVGTGAKGYLSDCWWVYDHITKELSCCWRKAYTVGASQYNDTDIMQLLYSSTKNGLVWSKPAQLYPDTLYGSDTLISPSIVFDENINKWRMFYMRGANIIVVRTNDDWKNPNGWSERVDLGFNTFKNANDPSMVAWHLEVKYLGDRLYGLITDTANMRYYLCHASKTDLTQWTYTTHNLLPTRPSGRPSLYKASFIADNIDSNSLQIRLFFTAGNSAESRLFTHLSNEISID